MKTYWIEQSITTTYRWELQAQDAQEALDACCYHTQDAVVIDDWYDSKPIVEEAL
jgi:hypothetical protein